MARLTLDDAAWTGAWRSRSVAEKSLLSLGLLALAVASTGPIASLGVLLSAVVAALVLARVPRRTYALALLAPIAFLAISLPAIAVSVGTSPVDPVWSAGWLHLEAGGVATAGEVGLRSVAALAAMLLLPLTTPMVSLLAGLRRMRVPEVLIDVAGLVYRMLFALLDSVAAIREAQSARLGYAGSAAARRSMGLLGAAVLRRAWVRSQRLEQGLAGRGYAGSLRTLDQPHPVDRGFVTATVVLLVVLAGLAVLTR